MDSIDDRQRDAESGRLLRAYTAEYRLAKRYRTVHFAISGLLATSGPLLSLWSLHAAAVVGALAGIWVLASRLVIIPAERAKVDLAVRIQERFDTRLFSMRWPEALAGREPSEEDIADAARRVSNDGRLSAQHIEGWYPSTSEIAWPVSVLLAQWASAAYGRRQHVAYFRFLAGCTSIVVVAVTAVGILLEMSLADWLIIFMLPSLPALLDVSELADSHRRLAAAKDAIETRIDALWHAELSSIGTLTIDDCRSVQDDAFRLRLNGVQIPDWFYWLHRDRNEANMHDAAAVRRAQYRTAGGG